MTFSSVAIKYSVSFFTEGSKHRHLISLVVLMQTVGSRGARQVISRLRNYDCRFPLKTPSMYLFTYMCVCVCVCVCNICNPQPSELWEQITAGTNVKTSMKLLKAPKFIRRMQTSTGKSQKVLCQQRVKGQLLPDESRCCPPEKTARKCTWVQLLLKRKRRKDTSDCIPTLVKCNN